MSNYNYYANMTKDANDRLCDHEKNLTCYWTIQSLPEQNNNSSKRSSLKRTESKMDEYHRGSDNNPDVESEADDAQWRYQGRSNRT